MSPDDIIAANLRRILAERDRPVAWLSRQLGVPRHVAYDMVHARKDRGQRAFRWSEVVDLATALDVKLGEIVLPDVENA